ncbi:Glycosyl transferase, group 1 [Oceanicola granulosus HTCC2516]|uniref:Glycosyl transferase, group 1 n=1 Tax=Oceanicola granulosus (strain ATCC BAA-861 / DSM 15982 / KCTC 12143 / HTCC2516) TaxID=314256 RepID=Q2CFT5_OCEGH|nr:glycosyltransferase [Oceanicola granulosus]EAR51607.1 Glycosyl transferase, group 1 [Oceanicola granulosus HTCC2516]
MSDARRAPVLGVITSGYHRAGETFVNHHIARLFGGRTVVICNRFLGDNPLEKPVFALEDQPRSAADRLAAPAAMAGGWLKHRALNVPTGSARQKLEAFLREHQVDVLLAEFGNRAIQFSPVARRLGLPLFTYFRGFDASKLLHEPLYVPAYQRLMPHLAGVFSVSQFLLDNLAAHDILHPSARVIPSGADTAAFRPGDKVAGEAVAVGRFVDKKAPMLTITAFLEAARHEPGARLHMVGDGPLLAACQAYVREKQAVERVVFHGEIGREGVRDRLARASVFLQHSVTEPNGNTEGLPSSIQEAMAAGCAIVSTRHAGIPEAVTDGVHGRLVEEHDRKGYAAAIGRLLAHPEQAAGMGRAARDTAVARFDKDRLTDRLEAALKGAL